MAYRNELAALETRRATLLRELQDLSVSSRELAGKRALCEAELASVNAALDGPARPLRVANPCGVAWDTMKGDERMRFCGVCAKNVYNLSAMSTFDVEALLRKRDRLCTRFYTRPDGTVLTTECRLARRRRRAPAVAGVVAFAALVGTTATFLGVSGEDIRVVSIGDLSNQAKDLVGRSVRAEGTLVHGSLVKHEAPCEFRFTLTGDGAEIPVRHAACVVPDTFRDVPGLELPVLMEGELSPDGWFDATSVTSHMAQGYTLKSPDKEKLALPEDGG